MFFRDAAVGRGRGLPAVGPRGRSSAGGACTGSSLVFWHQARCAPLRGWTLVSFHGGASGETLLSVLSEESVVCVTHKPRVDTATIVSVEHLLPSMNATVLVQREPSLQSQCLLVGKFLRRGKVL